MKTKCTQEIIELLNIGMCDLFDEYGFDRAQRISVSLAIASWLFTNVCATREVSDIDQVLATIRKYTLAAAARTTYH